jgi:hypothetical protein
MGVWGVAAFDNDGAADWFDVEFVESGADAVLSALDAALVTPEDEYLEADQGAAAMAAAESVATAFGRPVVGLADSIRSAIGEHSDAIVSLPQIRAIAISAIVRVRSENSELHELWTETDEIASDWAAESGDLMKRLGAH